MALRFASPRQLDPHLQQINSLLDEQIKRLLLRGLAAVYAVIDVFNETEDGIGASILQKKEVT